jgi:hypothetical protein
MVVACSAPAPAPVTEPATVAPPPSPDAPALASVLRTRFVKIEVVGGDQIGTLPVGSDRGVTKDWTGCLLVKDTDRCHPAGELVILRVEPRMTRVRVGPLEAEVILASPHVQLTAPP